MRTYKIIIIFISALLVGGTIGFFTTGFMSSGTIERSTDFTYNPSFPSSPEALKIQTDIGKINFKYNTSNLVHYATVDVDIQISGLFMQGKDYTAFFNPQSEWWVLENEFYLKVLPDIWFDPSYWFKSYDITIDVTLRTDIIYDITAITNVGSIEMTTANGVELNSLDLKATTGSVTFVSKENTGFLGNFNLETTTGSVSMVALENSTFNGVFALNTVTGSLVLSADISDFNNGMVFNTITGSMNMAITSCYLGDDLIGSVTTGSIGITMNDTLYTVDSALNLDVITGSITLNIYQSIDMNANITGALQTTTGSININYEDNVGNVGAQFSGSTGIGEVDYIASASKFTEIGDMLTSLNYIDPYVNTYTFSNIVTTGSITVEATSLI